MSELWFENPKKRSGSKKRKYNKKKTPTRKNNPRTYKTKAKTTRRRRRSNPPRIQDAFMTALQTFGGFYGASWVKKRLTPTLGLNLGPGLDPLLTVAAAFGIGWAVEEFARDRSLARNIVVGGVVKALSEFFGSQFGLSLGEYGISDYTPTNGRIPHTYVPDVIGTPTLHDRYEFEDVPERLRPLYN